MKKYFISFLLLLFAVTVFAQNNTKDYYLQKSKNKKTTAWVMLGGGSALLVTAAIIPRGEINGDGYGPGHKNDGLKSILGISGFLSMASSTIFFISSSKNKKKAMSMSIKNQVVPQMNNFGLVRRTVPSLNLKINL